MWTEAKRTGNGIRVWTKSFDEERSGRIIEWTRNTDGSTYYEYVVEGPGYRVTGDTGKWSDAARAATRTVNEWRA